VRVALVCDWFLPRLGGIELHLRDLAVALRASGADARIVTTTRGDDVVDGVPVHRVRAPLAPYSRFAYTPGALRAVEQVIRAERFDVVHAHASVVSPVAYGGAIAGSRAGPGPVGVLVDPQAAVSARTRDSAPRCIAVFIRTPSSDDGCAWHLPKRHRGSISDIRTAGRRRL
jgi:glycosyltransferase involved in cell wall biosynthesis